MEGGKKARKEERERKRRREERGEGEREERGDGEIERGKRRFHLLLQRRWNTGIYMKKDK